MSPLVSLFGGYYAGATATSAYERRWISPLVFPLVPCLVFFDILCVPLIAAHVALVRFCTDIVSLGANITSPTGSSRPPELCSSDFDQNICGIEEFWQKKHPRVGYAAGVAGLCLQPTTQGEVLEGPRDELT